MSPSRVNFTCEEPPAGALPPIGTHIDLNSEFLEKMLAVYDRCHFDDQVLLADIARLIECVCQHGEVRVEAVRWLR